MTAARTRGPVRIVGAGLLGASVGLALRALGVEVILADISPSVVRLAIDYGAGRAARAGDEPALVVVCVPPDVVTRTVAAELAEYPHALVTDVASVKAAPLAELREAGADLSRYVGSHPMAGRERGGAVSARADLFTGRPWVIASHPEAGSAAVHTIEALALDLGASPLEMDAAEHDRSAALVSHVPQVIASLLAAQLAGASDRSVALAGQGLRDTTRIASGDPDLWVQILAANSVPVVDILRAFRDDLDGVIDALDAITVPVTAPASRRSLTETIVQGNTGVSRIPGKHGQAKHYASIVVMVPDAPGELARLFTDIGEAGVNMEDLQLEHSPGAQIGFAEISVLPEVEQRLVDRLSAQGWKIAGAFA